MWPFFPSATTEIPENPKKELIPLWLPEGTSPLQPRHMRQGLRAEKASVLSLIIWLLSEQWGEVEDVVSKSTSL